jgi:hypothetical protein
MCIQINVGAQKLSAKPAQQVESAGCRINGRVTNLNEWVFSKERERSH